MNKLKNHNKHLISVNVNSPLSTRSGKVRVNNKLDDSLPDLDLNICQQTAAFECNDSHRTNYKNNLSSTILNHGDDSDADSVQCIDEEEEDVVKSKEEDEEDKCNSRICNLISGRKGLHYEQ